MKNIKKIGCALLAAVALLSSIWLAGRYGWKLFGFKVSETATIESVEVEEGQVHITGGYPGFMSKGFIGYVYQQDGDVLYVGYKYSSIFGFFETGVFDITIPTDGTVKEVYTKTNNSEILVYSKEK